MPSPDASGDVQGVPVWRIAANVPEFAHGYVEVPEIAQRMNLSEPGKWHSLAAEAQEARREAVFEALLDVFRQGMAPPEGVDAVLRVLGLAS